MLGLCFLKMVLFFVFLAFFISLSPCACDSPSASPPTVYPISIAVQVDGKELFLDVVLSEGEKVEKSAKVGLVSKEEKEFTWGLIKHTGGDNNPNVFAVIHR